MHSPMKAFRLYRLVVVTVALFLWFTTAAFSETVITGKVVGIADGDTITVLQDKTQYKIRLYGIDCPESHQNFGTRAKQFVSDLIFNKDVRVIVHDTDRYGRNVGQVFYNDLDVNQAMVQAGYAWVYPQYCKKSFCSAWNGFEQAAREKGIGLWSHPNPVPPWDFRRGVRGSSAEKNKDTSKNQEVTYHGNTSSMVFHQPACKHFNCKNCTAVFQDREEAIEAGYRPCGGCRPSGIHNASLKNAARGTY